MDKRYQVFVSSTYEDLQEERREVMQALLELECIPAGMELFPASNDDQWTLIKRVIDDSDYYLVIIGGRYGSTNPDGVSYTEMEYRYALETRKPIIAFLHKNPEEIITKYSEQTPDGKKKLDEFRALAKSKMVRYWTNPIELGSVVSRSMIILTKQCPAIGWIRADSASDDGSIREILRLKGENEDLKRKLQVSLVTAPSGTEKLAQGDDLLQLSLIYIAETANGVMKYLDRKVDLTWNSIFTAISPHLTFECKESELQETIAELAKNTCITTIREDMRKDKMKSARRFTILDDDFQGIKVQFKALGLITQSRKNRSVKDTANYWTLTEYGDHIMTQLIAKRRDA